MDTPIIDMVSWCPGCGDSFSHNMWVEKWCESHRSDAHRDTLNTPSTLPSMIGSAESLGEDNRAWNALVYGRSG